jgi:hypothetical protein
MKYKKTEQDNLARGTTITITATSAIEQSTSIKIIKTFKQKLAAGIWYAGREASIIHCLRELEGVCKGTD